MIEPARKRLRKFTLPEAFEYEPLSEMADDGDLSSECCSSEQLDKEPASLVAPVTPPILSHDDQDSYTDLGPATEETHECQFEDIADASTVSGDVDRDVLVSTPEFAISVYLIFEPLAEVAFPAPDFTLEHVDPVFI